MLELARNLKSGETSRPRAQDIDRHVGARMHERRIMLGLTQQEMGGLIGVTYQQTHKYEKGINRIAGGRLHTIAKALGVEVGYFYEGITTTTDDFKPTQQQRFLLELTCNFLAISNRRHQDALYKIVQALAHAERVQESDIDPAEDEELIDAP